MAAFLVKILNPIPGASREATLEHAEKFVLRGEAIFTSEKKRKIRFLGREERNELKARRAVQMERDWRFDDDIRFGRVATLEQIAGLPCLKPFELLLLQTKSRHYRPDHRNGKVRSIAA